MNLLMLIISVRFDFAAVRDVDVFVDVAEADWDDLDDVEVEELAVAAFHRFVVAGPSWSLLMAGSFHCEVFHGLVASMTTHDTIHKSCRLTVLIGFVGLTCRRRNRADDCISRVLLVAHRSSSRWVLDCCCVTRKLVGNLPAVPAR